jgi:DMSO/TMAO reductase YedYZ molybdopterin-dependent catalytic subunit
MAQAGRAADGRPGNVAACAGSGHAHPVLPPGQRISQAWPVRHYGPVPAFRPERWDLRVCGATESGREHRWDWRALCGLPRVRVTADLHCVSKFTIADATWEGVAAAQVLQLAPPAVTVTHVMVWAEFGYCANLPIGDFTSDLALLATHRDRAPLPPEHGYPVRLVVPRRYGWKSVKWVRMLEYMTVDRRGFWEQRGYHNTADPWREQRFSYQEEAGEGPPL